jgi:hypothetical protein
MADPIRCSSGWDPVKVFIDYKNYLERKRGSKPNLYSFGGMQASATVPNATWNEVAQFYASFTKKARQGVAALPSDVVNKARGVVEADLAWEKNAPFPVMVRTYGLAGAVKRMPELMIGETPYPEPHNSLFWDSGAKAAIALSSMGCIPGHWEITKEALVESVQELPATVANALDPILPSIPNVRPWADLFQWLTIGGGLFMLYWYVLRPKKK